MEDVKHKSRKKDASSKRSRDRDDKVRDRDSEKKNRRHRESRHSERETNVDDKHMDKHRDRDSRHKEREKDRRSHRDTSVEEEYKEKHKDRDSRRKESEKDRRSSGEEEYREKQKGRDSRRKESEKDRRSSGEDREPVSGSRSNDRDTKKEGDRDKEKDRERKAEKERERREKEKEREREERENIEREKEERENRERERAREKKEKEREREERENREKEKERDRARERREREIREKEKDKEREKRRRLDREDDVRDHERKRRKREEEYGERRSERHQDGDDDGRRIRTEEEERKTREQNLEEEQKKLDEDMEKRRRRVEEWQELKRKKEESENKILVISNQNEPKKWSFDEESDDDETSPPIKEDDDMQTDTGDAMVVGAGGDEDVDPLDAFMNAMVIPEVEKLNTPGNSLMDVDEDLDTKNDLKSGQANGVESRKGKNKAIGRIMPGEDSDSDYGDLENDEDPLQDEDDEEFMKKVKKTKVDRISLVDHSTIVYPPFRKNFYIEVKEISKMTSEEVVDYRKQMELKLHGKDIPKPIKTWVQTGLTSKVLEMIKKLGFEKPMPIQAQALPIIMSGRDCIGIAKTGSGKTLAFVLPMLRHIKDQPPVVAGDGPIGLIMAPTRELVQQIHSDIKKFAKVVGVSCVPVYGGSGIAQQISDLKRGTEIVVCTPGRMIDILCTSSGKITNLRRVTYLVMDEADRMFDMGFEPQITRIVQNIRPGRQTVLFSATFPRQVEILARQVLTKPIEIQIGGRSVVNSDITQLVEVRPEHERFLRLLELLGEWYEKGKILIFVQSQDKCDTLFRELLKHGYPCLSLHGAKDQTDRESTISDFKTNVCNLLIATSIAARGLDVKELELVINFDVPNHYEDYVHRVGRTGRAGRKGCAITFISEEDARYAPDLVKALELSQQVVPADLKALADGFMVKVNQGTEISHGSGYGGSGFKFNEEEDDVRKAAKKAQAREYGFEEDKSDSDSGDEDEGIRRVGDDLPSVLDLQMPVIASGNDGGARQMALVAAMNLKQKLAKIQADSKPEHFALEFDINDLPQNARWKLTHKETLAPISELFGVGITTKGQYCQAGKNSATGDRSLYLSIEGPTQISVKNAKAEVKRVLLEIMKQTSYFQGSSQPGKYSVL